MNDRDTEEFYAELARLAFEAERGVYALFAALDNGGELEQTTQEAARLVHDLRRITRQLSRGVAR